MEESTYITCITGGTVREVINKANELEIKKEDIINMFPLNSQVYLVFQRTK